MRVAMLAPERRDCGIGDHSRELVTCLRSHVALQTLPIERIDSAVDAIHAIDAGVVHLQYEHGFFLAGDDPAGNLDRLLSRLQRPTLVTLHCLPLADARWQRWLTAPGLAFHTMSRSFTDSLREMAPEARVFETVHPISRRVPVAETTATFRQRLDLGDRPVVAIFGFVKSHKGYDVAIDALEQLSDRVVLLIAGGAQDDDGEAFVARLRADARSRGLGERVRVTGYLRPDLVGAALGAADVVLAPFHTVTSSASLAAAIAWERPAVASDLPQFRELASRHGTPLCVPVGDAAALAEVLARLLEDEPARSRLSEAAAGIRAAHGFEQVAETIVGAYRELAGGGLDR